MIIFCILKKQFKYVDSHLSCYKVSVTGLKMRAIWRAFWTMNNKTYYFKFWGKRFLKITKIVMYSTMTQFIIFRKANLVLLIIDWMKTLFDCSFPARPEWEYNEILTNWGNIFRAQYFINWLITTLFVWYINQNSNFDCILMSIKRFLLQCRTVIHCDAILTHQSKCWGFAKSVIKLNETVLIFRHFILFE